ncbi:hypothetical protein CO613_07270 [Lysobacteraceae bacterium NML07-0707]|nr:hypothetical protein CO613_07270 [Xanthomonadaceae bacterium NML07-0707]
MNDALPPAASIAHRRNRNILLLIAMMVFGSFLAAGVLRFSGWQPAGMKNRGEMLKPPGDLRQLEPQLADGRRYQWQPLRRQWRILVVAPANCTSECRQLAENLEKVWQLSGRDANRVELLWLGGLPTGLASDSRLQALQESAAIRAALPGAEAATAPMTYIVDPNGFAILRYPPGHDPGDLRYDLMKLLKLR